MDGGRIEKVARAGRTAVTRTWSAISRTSWILAVVMRFLAKRSEKAAARYRAATGRLERISQVTNAKAQGIPLGVDLAGEEWEEPVLLPEVAPPPIPPAAFFKNEPTPAEEAEWRAALEAAKHSEPETDEWTAAMEAVKAAKAAPAAAVKDTAKAKTPAPVLARKASTPAPVVATTPPPVVATKASATPRPRPSATQPIRLTAELRVGPKPVAVRATEPRLTIRGMATASELGAAKSGPTAVDPHVAAATKKTIAAALRT
jgi:hypothetical protein